MHGRALQADQQGLDLQRKLGDRDGAGRRGDPASLLFQDRQFVHRGGVCRLRGQQHREVPGGGAVSRLAVHAGGARHLRDPLRHSDPLPSRRGASYPGGQANVPGLHEQQQSQSGGKDEGGGEVADGGATRTRTCRRGRRGVRRARIPAGLHLHVLVHLPPLRAPGARHQPRGPPLLSIQVTDGLPAPVVSMCGGHRLVAGGDRHVLNARDPEQHRPRLPLLPRRLLL
mmetsp:Transcript_11475/g.27789  ORF Transcript_11475/g.27789 Transcript_11475/m.27789 type:complete len:228 (+) Transcript_11475:1482-2165(+)